MKKRIVSNLVLVLGIILLSTACGPRQVDNGIYTSGSDGVTEEAAATDRAETTGTITDSTPAVMLADSVKNERVQL